MKTIVRANLAVPLLLLAGAAQSAQLYKSVGPDGRITYGDRPAAGAARSDVLRIDTDVNAVEPARPAKSATPQSGSHGTGSQPDYSEIIRRRGKAGDDSEVRAAESALEAARAALKDAQDNSTAEDWQYVRNGYRAGRFPRAEYAARLEALEQRIKDAEVAVVEAQRKLRLAS